MRAVVAAQLTAARKQEQYETGGSPTSSSTLPTRHQRPRTAAGKDPLRPSSRGPRRTYSPSAAAYRNPRDAAALSEIASWGVQVEARLRALEYEIIEQRSPTAPSPFGLGPSRSPPHCSSPFSEPLCMGGVFQNPDRGSPQQQQQQQSEHEEAWGEQQQQQQQQQQQEQEATAALSRLTELLERAETTQARAEALRQEEETAVSNRFQRLEASISASHAALGDRLNLMEDIREQLFRQADDLLRLDEKVAQHETSSPSVDVADLATRLQKCEGQLQALPPRKDPDMVATSSTLPGASIAPSEPCIQALEEKVNTLAAAVKKHSKGLLGLASDLSMEESMRNDRLHKLEEITQLLLRSFDGRQVMMGSNPSGGIADGQEPISLEDLRSTSAETSKKIAEVMPVIEDLRENIKELTYATSRHAARTAERLDDLERQLTQAHPSVASGSPQSRGSSTLAAPVPAQRFARNRLRSNTEELAKVVAAAAKEQGKAINVPKAVPEGDPMPKQAQRSGHRKGGHATKPILPTAPAGSGETSGCSNDVSLRSNNSSPGHNRDLNLGDESPYSPTSPLSPSSMAAAAARMAVVAASMTTTVTPPPQDFASPLPPPADATTPELAAT